jgi:HK97 gp10 family phage protein
MSDGVTVKISGLDGITKALGEMRKATARGVMQRVMKEEAQPIADMARSLVPVRHGQLRNAIVVTTKRPRGHKTAAARAFASAGGGAAGRAASKAAGATPATAFVAITRRAPHAHLVEFGSRNNRPSGFMRRALDTLKRGAIKNTGAKVWAEIRKTNARIAKRRR